MSKKIYKIVFLCHFSNPLVRKNLELKNFNFRNCIAKILHRKPYNYDDFAIWVSDYIKEFEKHNDFEFWVVAPHRGMKVEKQTFDVNGIHYFFYKCDYNFFCSFLNSKFHLQEKTDFRTNRKRIKTIIDGIQPNVIILCGAENPYYSLGVLDIKNLPVYVILQTLLNDPKRIEMGVGSPYRRKSELEVFCHARFFSTIVKQEIEVIKRVNNKAVFLHSGFPTHRPEVPIPDNKDYDFVFFSRYVTKNKGIEDLLKALLIVKNTHKEIRLNIIGEIKDDYKKLLDDLIQRTELSNNVYFSGYFLQIGDMYKNVVKARVVVVPGITAALNSTVRESMLIGLPTICYETFATEDINKEKCCLITAQMGNVNGLAKQMQWAIENTANLQDIAKNGKEYAEKVFGNETIVNRMLDYCCQIIEKKV